MARSAPFVDPFGGAADGGIRAPLFRTLRRLIAR
jgi:hypothetical protein